MEETKSLEEIKNIFDKPVATQDDKKADKDKLLDSMFDQAVMHNMQNDQDLQEKVLGTAKSYTETKMQVISTDVDTERKKAIFNNQKSACESYGFTENTTPIWAIKFMNIGYNIMLAIWLIIGTFTFMPVIFIFKKVKVLIKQAWLSILVAILIYLAFTVAVPLIATYIKF